MYMYVFILKKIHGHLELQIAAFVLNRQMHIRKIQIRIMIKCRLRWFI